MAKPLLIAHRGDTSEFPENTMEAFASAFEKGADGVELDIHELDGRLVVVHNYTFDRTKKYPELNEVLSSFGDKGKIQIEIKPLDLEFMTPLRKALDQYPGATIELTTSVAGLISYIRSEFPDKQLGAILPKTEFEPWMAEEGFLVPKITKLAKLYKADAVHLYADITTKEVVDALHGADVDVNTHIVSQPIEDQVSLYHQLSELGVNEIAIDDISLIQLVKES